MRPRVLAVTSEPPWPLDSGGHLRTFHLLKPLAETAELRVICPVQPHQSDAVQPLREAGFDLRPVSVPPRSGWREAGRVSEAMLLGEPYVMYRRHAWRDVRAAWRDELARARPDVVYLDHLDSALYVSDTPRPSAPPAVFDLHNVYSLIARRTAAEQRSPVTRRWLTAEARRLERVERRVAASGQRIFAVSDADATYFRGLGARDVHAVPNGVDCGALADLPVGRTGPPVVLFLGTLSWGPNAAAARFLAHTAFPALQARVPAARLLIVGRNPPDDLADLHGGAVTVTGAVPDVRPYLAEASVLAVPLEAGGGTRLKILDAFAAGLPVVSTRVGAEGLTAEPHTHYWPAEREGFSEALAHLLSCHSAGRRLAEAARTLVRAEYDWRQIGTHAAGRVVELGRRPGV